MENMQLMALIPTYPISLPHISPLLPCAPLNFCLGLNL